MLRHAATRRRALVQSFLVALPFCAAALAAEPGTPGRADVAPFHLQEATIDGIHAELRSGRLSCVRLVQSYINRIAAYDQTGPSLNSIQNINPAALRIAADLDARFKASGEFAGALHCIPILVKDDIDTSFMPTTFGSALFKDFIPKDDATIIRRLQDAGAVILAKTNMGEFAQGYSGSAFGDCHNAYNPNRSPSGSSCGTGVGIAANFAAAGIGEDTEGSIRGPASHGSLVGLRPTVPLVSRAGMMPFAPSRDTLGPITRTVRDAAIVLDVIAGYDPNDPITSRSYGRIPGSYTAFLRANGLAGMRFGVIREPMSRDTDTNAADYKEIRAAVSGAVAVLIERGAEVIDPLPVPGLMDLLAATGGGGGAETESAINTYLAGQPNSPVHSLREIVASPLVSSKRRDELGRSIGRKLDDGAFAKQQVAREELSTLILRIMADNKLDALIYATYDHAPAVVPKSTPGTNRVLASALAFPAMSVPAGFFSDGLPIGLEFLGRPFDEGSLFRAAYDYEQSSRRRRPPALTPPLAGEP
jgi:amidase